MIVINFSTVIAKLLRKYHKNDLALKFLRRTLDRNPKSTSAFREFCINRMASRDFLAIKDQCKIVSKLLNPSDHLRNEAVAFFTRSSLDDDADQETLMLLNNRFRQKTQICENLRFSGDLVEGGKAFGESLTLAGIPENAKNYWMESYNVLTGLQAPSSYPGEYQNTETVKKIVVSGMYWTGSGAIYDYLREFKQITAVAGELRLWKEGDFCLNTLESLLDSPVQFNDTLFRLMTIAFTGTSPVKNWQEELAVNYAFASSRTDLDSKYARACMQFIEEAIYLISEKTGRREKFIAAAERLSDSLSRYWTGEASNIVLFDNVVHIGGINAIRLLGDARALCSFRDPRSNFVARWYENPRFHRDVGRFIEYYRNTRESFEEAMTVSPTLASRVHRVCFEDFIQSEKYRDDIAQSCGLDLNCRDKGRYFKPDASRKNIANYTDFPDQKTIRMIERELGAYCIEITDTLEVSRAN